MLPDIRPDLLVKETAGFDAYVEDPKIEMTNEQPPVVLNDDDEVITIDDYLGVYLPEEKRVKVFSKNIETASKILECTALSLEYVVRYHEHAHAVIHLGTDRKNRIKALNNAEHKEQQLKELTEKYYRIEPNLHEQLAQLLTYHTLQSIKLKQKNDERKGVAQSLINTFERLSKRQPPQYRISSFINTPLQRIIDSLHFIRRGWLVGEIEPWKRMMLWP